MTVFIDYPKPNEKIGSAYTINIIAETAENVRVSIDKGGLRPERTAPPEAALGLEWQTELYPPR